MHRDDFDAALIPGFRAATETHYRALVSAQTSDERTRLESAGDGEAAVWTRRACPLCGTGAGAGLLRKAGLDIVRCAGCAMVYSRTTLVDTQNRAFYGASAFQAAYLNLKRNPAYTALEELKCRYIVEMLAKHVPPGRLLEIGSGAGKFLEAAKAAGWQTVGIEPNPLFAAECAKRNLHVIEGWFPESLQDPGPFAALAMLDVLEHAADPKALLESARARLPSGGILVVQVPNFDSLILRLEGVESPVICQGHWNYFDDRSLIRCGASIGLRVVHTETIISELDRIAGFSRERIAEVVSEIVPGSAIPQALTAEWLHAHRMGLKLLVYFRVG